ncbi:EamA/RhaT family transporter [Paenibacillus chitinolyticus]|uniref:DMT family transporter n=1 Tax=Paenibacillus chitinolyticus TaxID=79263 RepID=A0A410WZM9_9BACL|nr:DMT family transporter [Paenibacillus chitinolyticus]MCY9590348.1 DMT family transporter [Paenibacillus chitinolyticus]MCY9596658.1 DMT family transporter [Paenibacillus chitinolyticus]QAV19662.1 EamA/RhaT family transporter [Paenibacillus chitinolyticus]
MQLSRTLTFILLTFLVMLWGVNWPLSKYALEFAPPLLFAGLRIFIGGLILLIFALPRYRKLNMRHTWNIYLISALLNIILFFGFQTFGLNMMPAGLFSTIVFMQPVLLGIGAWLWLGESMTGFKIIGLILGFIGVAVISINDGSGNISSAGILLGLASTITWTFGTIYMKKTSTRVDAIWLTTLQMIFGGIVLLVAGTTVENWTDIVWNQPFISTLSVIAIFCTALTWLVFFLLVRSGEAGKIGSFNFLVPLIAIVISVLVLGETITPKMVVGLILIIIGVALVNLKLKSLQKRDKKHMGNMKARKDNV